MQTIAEPRMRILAETQAEEIIAPEAKVWQSEFNESIDVQSSTLVVQDNRTLVVQETPLILWENIMKRRE